MRRPRPGPVRRVRAPREGAGAPPPSSAGTPRPAAAPTWTTRRASTPRASGLPAARAGCARRREGKEERRSVAGMPVEPCGDEAVQSARVVVHDAREAEIQDERAPAVAEPRVLDRGRSFRDGSRIEKARDVANREVRQDRSRGEFLSPTPSSRPTPRGLGRDA